MNMYILNCSYQPSMQVFEWQIFLCQRLQRTKTDFSVMILTFNMLFCHVSQIFLASKVKLLYFNFQFLCRNNKAYSVGVTLYSQFFCFSQFYGFIICIYSLFLSRHPTSKCLLKKETQHSMLSIAFHLFLFSIFI